MALRSIKKTPIASVAKSSNLGVESNQNELSHVSLILPQHIRINWKPKQPEIQHSESQRDDSNEEEIPLFENVKLLKDIINSNHDTVGNSMQTTIKPTQHSMTQRINTEIYPPKRAMAQLPLQLMQPTISPTHI